MSGSNLAPGVDSMVRSLPFVSAPLTYLHSDAYALAGPSAHLGDVIYINTLGQDTIILNSSKAAIDLLDKRSAIYSNRPVFMMFGEIVGWKKVVTLTQYGPRFRESRKFIARLIGTRESAAKFAPIQEREMAKCFARVMTDPGSLVHQIRKLVIWRNGRLWFPRSSSLCLLFLAIHCFSPLGHSVAQTGTDIGFSSSAL